MINTLFLPELREMLASNDADGLAEFCMALHPAAIAEFMSGLTSAEAWAVLSHAPADVRTEVFHYFEAERQLEILATQERTEVAGVLAEMAPDDRVDLMNQVDPALAEELLKLLPKEDRRETLRLQAYPEGTAGAVMTTEVVRLAENLTVKQALDELQKRSDEVETIYYLYVVDDGNHLRGVLSTRDLISSLSSPNRTLGEIMDTSVISVDAHDDQEAVAQKVAQFDLLAIPVVDEQHQMLGIITHDDVIDVVREEATEDAHLSAGVAPLESGYLQTAIGNLCWNRGIWLAPLFFAALLTAKAIQFYETELDTWPFLIFFLPLIISSGGNSGNQSATLIITGLTTGDVKLADWLRVLGRELLMGVLLGGLLAIVFVSIGWSLSKAGLMDIGREELVVVPITLILVVVCGTLVGSVLPLVFCRLGQDPALMSNPFVAGIIDIVGIIVYVQVAVAMLT